ncbi:MAG: PspC domain-containing protein [Alphaproteobacteria bacterium]|nr:PspC domain-containing protein [Alphaproteobacteria bacterium]MBV9372219.1 PspC domain-containing protein [Alphaproteobacteria bacterium]MBV9901670.1 PspC domain-containing protein [Alphaproteobacteria bacterium]
MTRPFALDRANRKLSGVCAGIAAATEVDVTLVRLAAVASLFIIGPAAVAIYLVAAWVAPEAA